MLWLLVLFLACSADVPVAETPPADPPEAETPEPSAFSEGTWRASGKYTDSTLQLTQGKKGRWRIELIGGGHNHTGVSGATPASCTLPARGREAGDTIRARLTSEHKEPLKFTIRKVGADLEIADLDVRCGARTNFNGLYAAP